ncbi:uncharacterized protein PRCAT00004160001 [Priceomyces carsonii]|uniref:uncharacterized protein n=1 Tax=Priceomyces carsonii TaxID=28549 RepID=UPI002ED93037|nr:unnamed protein product [Priceomyces carsonii]
MRASQILLNATKNKSPGVKAPVEMYPLFAAVGVAIASGFFFTYRHFAHDRQLRLWRNPDLSELSNVLEEAEKKEKK